MEPAVAVLFARADSCYKKIAGLEVYDIGRDARTYNGPLPIIAHPPCRAWGQLYKFAKPRPDERNLGRLAVSLVREFGGVLEHPAYSKLFDACRIPRPGSRPDQWGGWTLPIEQFHWGHRAEKKTWLYIVGCPIEKIPKMPRKSGKPTHYIMSPPAKYRKPGILLCTKAEREHTPMDLAHWLKELAMCCKCPTQMNIF